jgi:hypothetical protein
LKPDWWRICENQELEGFFCEMARTKTRIPELQDDLRQEAWLAVCEYLSGIKPPAGTDDARTQKSLEYYKNIGYRAMDRLRKREEKYRELFKPWIGSAHYQRSRRMKFKKRRKKI